MAEVLLVSDIDGVIRDLYTPVYKEYSKYNKYITFEDFLESLIYFHTPENASLVLNLIDKAGGDNLYKNAVYDEKMIEFYKSLMNDGINLLFLTTYTTENRNKITADQIRNIFGKNPVIIFHKHGLTNKTVPSQFHIKYNKFIVIEDNTLQLKNIVCNIIGNGFRNILALRYVINVTPKIDNKVYDLFKSRIKKMLKK
ncbi:MAG: hypothetical protein ABIM30_00465 [candidate division WOR-3 bacterium]